MDGYILIDKPVGWTSFDVVAKLRGLVRTANRRTMAAAAGGTTGPARQLPKRVKAGHAGTLDPLASGLLVVMIGAYTKRATELMKLDKTYEVVMTLGQVSTTGDGEGGKTSVSDRRPSSSELRDALTSFTGDIMQTPPAYSAMKINGVRAYKLARQGKEVIIEPRPVTVHRLELTGYEYPLVRFTADVSSGTYIRSLVEDLGKMLTTGAYMSGLRRTRIGRFNLTEAVEPQSLQAETIAGLLRQL